MNHTKRNLRLLLALVLVIGLHWLIRPVTERPVAPLPMSNMDRGPAAEAFAASRVLPRGMVLQPPVPGTVARDQQPLPYGPDAASAERAGVELRNPIAADDAAAAARGAEVYRNFCATCHGPTGMGDGPVTRRGVPPPPSLLADNALGLPDGRIFHLITFGQKNMPGYATQISPDDRWKAVLHVRALQAPARGEARP